MFAEAERKKKKKEVEELRCVFSTRIIEYVKSLEKDFALQLERQRENQNCLY